MTLVAAVSSPGRIITVDDDNPADFTTIQAAINDANDGDTVEIQTGTYTGEGNRDISFLGKAITVRSTDPADPCTVAQTIIASDAGYSFLFQADEDADSVIDGLAFTDGPISIADSAATILNCTFASINRPIRCDPNGVLTMAKCIFLDNYHSREGGAIWLNQSEATLADCIFRGNHINSFDGYDGGAIHSMESNVTVQRCLFEDNYAPAAGGAVSARDGELTFTDCLFTGCSAANGAAVYAWRTYHTLVHDLTVVNCQFIGNRNTYSMFHDGYRHGGAVCVANGGNATIVNSLFAGNNSTLVAGVLVVSSTDVDIKNCTFADNHGLSANTLVSEYVILDNSPSNIHVENSIIGDGADSIVINDESNLLVTFSDVQGTVPGYGNIDADPCFADPGYWVDSRDPNIVVDPNHEYASWMHGDYHLKSQAGRWVTDEGRWTMDDVTSPCIDAGDPNSPIGLEPFPNGGLVNMGAYGGTDEASKSYFGGPPCEVIVAGDINGDCMVNFLDFSLMGAHWLGKRICPEVLCKPNPADNAEDVPITQRLTWTPSCDATSWRVYFGTESPGQYQGEQEMLIFDPCGLEYNTGYYWHIVENTPTGAVVGPTWSFETLFRLDPATNPNPPDGTPNTTLNLNLSWTPGIGAESHDVYFGRTNPPEFRTNQTAIMFNTGELSEETTYYWRIDEVNSKGKTEGTVWSFTTGTGGGTR
jgi:hypothetical protein